MSKQRQPNQAERQALNEGAAAAQAGKTEDDCPYRDAFNLRFMWLTGHSGELLKAEAERKKAEEEAMKKDAARYRWLVEMDELGSPSVDMANAFSKLTGAALDAFIDQAMSNGSRA